MKNYINDLKEMRSYLLLWFTQRDRRKFCVIDKV